MGNRKNSLLAVRTAGMILLIISLVFSGCGSANGEALSVDTTESVDVTTGEDMAANTEETDSDGYSQEEYNPDDYDLDEESRKRLDDFNEKLYLEQMEFEEKSLESNDFYTLIYDSDGLDQVLGNTKEDVTYDDIRAAIDLLDTTEKVKDIYKTLADNLEKQYPTMDLRMWLKNLETMEIEFMSDVYFDYVGVDSGIYIEASNKIILQEELEPKPGTLEYQIFVHEMAHPIKVASFSIGEKKFEWTFSEKPITDYRYANEAMNSILALRSYDPDETQIAYPLTSHMYEVMIENMDNYTLQDYVDEDVYYFISKLNETNGDNQALKILKLIELKCSDTKDDSVHFPQSLFYDVYDYIARMHYRNHISKDMTPEEIEKVKDDLVTRLAAGISKNTEFDTKHFDDYLEEYCQENGINRGQYAS